MLLGGNSSTIGFTDRCRGAAEVFGPGVMLWLSSAGPQDAARYPNCVHLLRLDNWMPGESPDRSYVPRISPTLTAWRDVPNLVAVLGNEPDLEAGHHGEEIAAYAAAVRVAFPGIKIGNPPLSVEQSVHVSANGCDVVLMHGYFERQHPESASNWQFGASYQFGLDIAAGRPVYVSEFNVVQTNCPIDWPDRNKQAAKWLDQAEADGVAGVCFFILDGVNEWASFDVGPEAAAEIISLRAKTQPEKPTMIYTRDTRPMHTGAAYQADAWLVALRGRNPGEAERIVATYGTCAAALGYDGNLMIAQGWVETAGFTSARWRNAHNAAGIGIYSDNTPDVQFGTAERGIQAQAALLSDYFGDGRDPWGVLAEYGFGFATPLGKVTLRDLDGVWAADTGYSAAIVAVANSVTGGFVGPIDPVKPIDPTGIPLSAVADMLLTQLGQMRSGAFDTHNGDHPWWLYCQAAVESTLRQLGVPLGPFVSAAQCAAAMEAAGLIHHDTNYPYGAVLVWGEAFYKDGHTAIGLDHFAGTFVGTTDQGIQIRAGWQDQPGYIGWYIPPGIAEMEDDLFTVDGLIDDGRLDAAWFGTDAPTATAKRTMPRVKGHGIPDRWEREFRAGRNLGPVRTKEKKADNTGAIIQYFTSGWIVWYPDGSTSVN